jgi:hypothetical protein
MANDDASPKSFDRKKVIPFHELAFSDPFLSSTVRQLVWFGLVSQGVALRDVCSLDEGGWSKNERRL